MSHRILSTPLAGVLLVEPTVHRDERGHLVETYQRAAFAAAGIDVEFVQDNQARSRRGTLRGLHFQRRHPQAKLIRASRGSVFDVVVDLRRSSATFGRWHAAVLDDRAHRALFVPAGFAHGYLALEEPSDVAYKISERHRPDDEGGVAWDDPDLAIAWPLEDLGSPLVSDKDRRLPRLRDLGFAYP
jgi:dTDP-4-dehydrorhamnose 3,5-epimerase